MATVYVLEHEEFDLGFGAKFSAAAAGLMIVLTLLFPIKSDTTRRSRGDSFADSAEAVHRHKPRNFCKYSSLPGNSGSAFQRTLLAQAHDLRGVHKSRDDGDGGMLYAAWILLCRLRKDTWSVHRGVQQEGISPDTHDDPEFYRIGSPPTARTQ